MEEGEKIVCGSVGVKYFWVDSRKSQVFVLQAKLVVVFVAEALSDNEFIAVILRRWDLHYFPDILVSRLNCAVPLPC